MLVRISTRGLIPFIETDKYDLGIIAKFYFYPANIYLPKVNNWNR